jgi:type II secretory pathway pseudopilin PulG
MRTENGFTLIELLVSLGIIIIMTVLVLPNYRFGDSQLALQRTAHQAAQIIRLAQEYAISAKEYGGAVPAGYGVYFNASSEAQCILFADADGNHAYSGITEKVDTIVFEERIILTALGPGSGASLTILFLPPDPSVIFIPNGTSAFVTLNVKNETGSNPVNVQINKAGLIAIQ